MSSPKNAVNNETNSLTNNKHFSSSQPLLAKSTKNPSQEPKSSSGGSASSPTNPTPVILNISRNSITNAAKFKINTAKLTLIEEHRQLNKATKLKKEQQKQQRKPNQQQQKGESNKQKTNKTNNEMNPLDQQNNYKTPRCRMTFVFDPNGRLSYWMGRSSFNLKTDFLI